MANKSVDVWQLLRVVNILSCLTSAILRIFFAAPSSEQIIACYTFKNTFTEYTFPYLWRTYSSQRSASSRDCTYCRRGTSTARSANRDCSLKISRFRVVESSLRSQNKKNTFYVTKNTCTTLSAWYNWLNFWVNSSLRLSTALFNVSKVCDLGFCTTFSDESQNTQ